MPFDFAPLASPVPSELAPLHGVPRHRLVAHAMEQLPPALRAQVAEMQVSEAGTISHLGLELDRVAWRAVWRRAGLPVTTGAFAIWNGKPV